MTIFNNIVNNEFRDFAGTSRYPFTDGSTMRSSDGRTVQDSVFLDAVIYPDDGINGNMWIYGMRTNAAGDLDIGIMRNEVVFGRCVISKGNTVGFVWSANGLTCGTVVAKEEGIKYLSGLASYSTLFFNPEGLRFRADRVLPILRKKIHITVNGTALLDQSKPVTVSFTSDRFATTDTTGGTLVSFDNSVREPLRRSEQRIQTLRPATEAEGGTTTDGLPHSVTLMAPRWSNLQVLTENNKLLIHKRGD